MQTSENTQLEEERLELKGKLRFSASQRAQFALSMGLDAEQVKSCTTEIDIHK